MKAKWFTVPVHVNDEYGTADGPTHAKILIDVKTAKHIRSLAKFVERRKLLCTEEFDYSPDFFVDTGEVDKFDNPILKRWEGNADVMCLRIYDHGFQWSGMLKRTQIHMETEEISLKQIGALCL